MLFLTLPELMHVAERALDPDLLVRDPGLLHAALARPQATAFGVEEYPSLEQKAAALLHSLARNQALVDGNKRLALAATIAFLGLNGQHLTLNNDEAYTLIMDVAAGRLDDITRISELIAAGTEARHP